MSDLYENEEMSSLLVLTLLAWVFSGYSSFLPQSKNMFLRFLVFCVTYRTDLSLWLQLSTHLYNCRSIFLSTKHLKAPKDFSASLHTQSCITIIARAAGHFKWCNHYLHHLHNHYCIVFTAPLVTLSLLDECPYCCTAVMVLLHKWCPYITERLPVLICHFFVLSQLLVTAILILILPNTNSLCDLLGQE